MATPNTDTAEETRLPAAAASDNSGILNLDAFERHLECFAVGGHFHGHFAVDQLIVDELLEAHCKVLHAVVLADANDIRQLFVVFLENRLLHVRVEDHDLARWHTADARLDALEQLLSDDAPHVERDRAAQCRTIIRREQVENTSDGRGGTGSVDG